MSATRAISRPRIVAGLLLTIVGAWELLGFVLDERTGDAPGAGIGVLGAVIGACCVVGGITWAYLGLRRKR